MGAMVLSIHAKMLDFKIMRCCMTYTLTHEMISSITKGEKAFSTQRLLPAWDQIPEDFKRGNIYTKVIEASFYGLKPPSVDIEPKKGFNIDAVRLCVNSHIGSFGPKHEHKMAGIGYMLSIMATVTPIDLGPEQVESGQQNQD